MAGFTDYHAHILEAGSAVKKGDTADPRLLRYNTAYYPIDVGVELVIADMEQLRHLAEMQEPRLAVELEKLVVGYDCALASKSSEGGRRMTEFRNSETMDKLNAKLQTDSIDELNFSKSKAYDVRKA